MNTIILNGSPKGNAANSASYFLAKAFINDMNNPYEIISIAKTEISEIIEQISGYDNIIFFMPNYVHAMPGSVMKLLEKFPSASNNKKSLGFIMQAGYMETVEEEIVSRYFEGFTKRMGYNFLGFVAKGEAAGIAIFPDKFKKLSRKFSEFGKIYENTGIFDIKYVNEFSKPYELSKFLALLITVVNKIGLGDYGWNMMLKKHNAYEKRYDRPFQ